MTAVLELEGTSGQSVTDLIRLIVTSSCLGHERKESQMLRSQKSEAVLLEGRRVSVALRDGSRVDDCQLVSAGRGRVPNLWIYTEGADVFFPIDDVVAIWEVAA